MALGLLPQEAPRQTQGDRQGIKRYVWGRFHKGQYTTAFCGGCRMVSAPHNGRALGALWARGGAIFLLAIYWRLRRGSEDMERSQHVPPDDNLAIRLL